MSKSEIALGELIIGVGFFGGLFSSAGIDPEGEFVKALSQALISINQTQIAQNLSLFYFSLSAISTLFSIITIYRLGGIIGLIALMFAFISGLIIQSFPELGAILMLIAIGLGMFAENEKITFSGII